MALNISLNVAVAKAFNADVSSRVDNRIQLGDRVAPGASVVNSSSLQGNLGADALGAAGTPPSSRLNDGGPQPAGGAPGRHRSPPSRRQASPEPADGKAPAPLGPSSSAPEIRSALRSPSTSVDAALRDASAAHGFDVNTLRGISSIESSMNPASNRNRRTQYKGLFQLNQSEFQRYGGGDIYNAHDNAMAAARKLGDDRSWFKSRFHREPSDADLYMIHQQGRGFFTKGAMTNIGGNRYPGMRGPQTPASFEAGWGRELARREDAFRRAAGAGKPTITLK